MNMQTISLTSTGSARSTSRCLVGGYVSEIAFVEYDICPSCGTEFGVNDRNATIAQLRGAWLQTGPRWWSEYDAVPEGWNPDQQLRGLENAIRPIERSGPVEADKLTVFEIGRRGPSRASVSFGDHREWNLNHGSGR